MNVDRISIQYGPKPSFVIYYSEIFTSLHYKKANEVQVNFQHFPSVIKGLMMSTLEQLKLKYPGANTWQKVCFLMIWSL
ncbi:hypothetical protein B9037_012905 [Klebsiella aerogenes]|nr:hypothetical protein B9037_012905 [Klebsiella aerogenes]